MLLKQRVLNGIADGRITLAFRRWKRPTVKAGGTLRTAIGVLAIEAVDVVAEKDITHQDAERAGYPCRAALLDELADRKEGKLYRIALHLAGADPRHALRGQDTLSEDELQDVRSRLARMDARSTHGAWTTRTLELIAAHPGQRATELADSVGMEPKRFKGNVRRLKEMGLTESLKVGYRLSPRGEAVLRELQS